MYTAIERLVTAGLAGPTVLNTRPMSRIEMARIVAAAVRKIREDTRGELVRRADLQPILYRLLDELAPELETLGVRTREAGPGEQYWLELQPISNLQARVYWTENAAKPENLQGLALGEGFSGLMDVSSFGQVGEFFSAYVHPQFQVGEDDRDARLVEGYAKLQWKNLALRIGRQSLWWGPGYHGTLLFGNNAPPLDQVRIGTAEPFELPWLFKYLGPVRFELLYARLEEDRDHPHAKLAAWRLDLAPFSFLELGVGRVVQFDGGGRPSMDPLDYLAVLVVSKDDRNSKYNTNTILSLDAAIRIRDVDRVFPLTKDLVLYGELGVDDTCCEHVVWPLKPAYLIGVYFPNFFRRGDTEFRVEWTQTTSFSFSHGIYTDGYSHDGFPIAHYVGTRGQDLYFRVAERVDPRLQVGLEFGVAKVGPTDIRLLNVPREERKYAGIDLSYRATDRFSLLFGYRYERVEHANFTANQQETDHIVRLEATYSFSGWATGRIGRRLTTTETQ
jgi:hypothetical protein